MADQTLVKDVLPIDSPAKVLNAKDFQDKSYRGLYGLLAYAVAVFNAYLPWVPIVGPSLNRVFLSVGVTWTDFNKDVSEQGITFAVKKQINKLNLVEAVKEILETTFKLQQRFIQFCLLEARLDSIVSATSKSNFERIVKRICSFRLIQCGLYVIEITLKYIGKSFDLVAEIQHAEIKHLRRICRILLKLGGSKPEESPALLPEGIEESNLGSGKETTLCPASDSKVQEPEILNGHCVGATTVSTTSNSDTLENSATLIPEKHS